MSNIAERCEKILEYRRCQVVEFHEEYYTWNIGVNCLNELIDESNIRYVPFNRHKNKPTLFGIEYEIHPDNNCLELVSKGYADIDIIFDMKNRRIKPEERIKNVIFSNPATIVFWDDGTKTVVKANGDDPYDPEKGLAIAITKKFFGTNKNKSNYYDIFKKWLPKDEKETKKTVDKGVDDCYYTIKELSEIFNISRDKVRNNIKNGLYPNAIKQSGAWLIPYNDFKSMLSKKNCSTCVYSKSPVSPYDDPLHPCNLCSLEKKND